MFPPDLDISYHLSQGSFFSPNQKMRCQPAFLEDTPKLYKCESPQVLPLSLVLELIPSPHEGHKKKETSLFFIIFPCLKNYFPPPKSYTGRWCGRLGWGQRDTGRMEFVVVWDLLKVLPLSKSFWKAAIPMAGHSLRLQCGET